MTDRQKKLAKEYSDVVERLVDLLRDDDECPVEEIAEAAIAFYEAKYSEHHLEAGMKFYLPSNLSWQVSESKLGGREYVLTEETYLPYREGWYAVSGDITIEISAELAEDLIYDIPHNDFVYVGDRKGMAVLR